MRQEHITFRHNAVVLSLRSQQHLVKFELFTPCIFVKLWLEELLSNFQRPPILKFVNETAVNNVFQRKFAEF